MVVLFAAVACDRADGGAPAPSASIPAAASPSAPLAALPPPRAVAAEVAFDLVSAGERVLLVWATPSGALRVAPLDAGGAPAGDARDVGRAEPTNKKAEAKVLEVAAAATDDAVAVTWVQEEGRELSAWESFGSRAELRFLPPVALGGMSAGDRARRGHLAMTTEGERLLVMHRGMTTPCSDGDQHCTAFATHELSARGARERGLPLSVPAACGVGVAGYGAVKGRWHYAVCSTASGTAETTLFNVQQEPNYAEAKTVLSGCTPRGALMLDGDVILGGDCPGGPHAVRAGAMETPLTDIELAEAKMTCELGHPKIEAPAFSLVLRDPMGELSPLLPAEVAPRGARAVWTGVALLVARWVAGKVTLRRYECRAGRFTRAG